MNTPQLVAALIQLGNARERAKAKRYALIGECMHLECAIEGTRHTAKSFNETCDILLDSDTLTLEAMIHAYKIQLNEQFPAAIKPVRVTKPCTPNDDDGN